MSTKHTQGAWEIADADSVLNMFGDEISIEVLDCDGFPVADVPIEPILHNWPERFPDMGHWADGAESGKTVKTRSHEEAIANARLIAAAPELLEALERINSLSASQFLTQAAFSAGCQHIARAAIAKATGEAA